MAEVFKVTDAGATAQHFVQFVMMYQQQTLHALARHPQSPPGSRPNLELARAFILQLAAIRDRTRGNLSREESSVLETALKNLEQGYTEAAR